MPSATPSLPKPKAITPMPPSTMAMMVTILIRANQNSNSPKAFT
uniref:Alternative protein n=1 Tax=Steinernema glaseri TaxID=37863 RepID=A0A1I7YDS7_9BILA